MKQSNIKDLYVLDATEPMCVYGSRTMQFEESLVLKNCICKQEINKSKETIYRNLETNTYYEITNELGHYRANKDTISPLEEYYKLRYILQNIKELKEIHKVHSKVRNLKRRNRI